MGMSSTLTVGYQVLRFVLHVIVVGGLFHFSNGLNGSYYNVLNWVFFHVSRTSNDSHCDKYNPETYKNKGLTEQEALE